MGINTWELDGKHMEFAIFLTAITRLIAGSGGEYGGFFKLQREVSATCNLALQLKVA